MSATRCELAAACAGMALALTLVVGSPAEGAVFKPETFTLDNGMQVVVVTNRRAPVVSHHVWYKVGSADSPLGKSGLAHFLEHLMFKGTANLEPGEFSRIVARNGGNENAFTGPDYTGYFQTIAKDRLELVMRMEADRMVNLVLDDDEVVRERSVVLEERSQRTDNDPGARLGEQLNATQFYHHPYRLPVIGWRHEMETYSREDALDFYRAWYAPNNAVLIVAGDIDAAELRPLAEKYYGAIPARPVPERDRVQEPPQDARREVVLSDPRVQQPYWLRSYLAPSFSAGASEHAYPLEVLSEILGGTSTSRLYRSLVIEQKLATSAGAYYRGTALDLTTFRVYATPRPGVSLDQLEAAVEAELDRLEARADHGPGGRARHAAPGRRGDLRSGQPRQRGAQLRRRARHRAHGRGRGGVARADRRGHGGPDQSRRGARLPARAVGHRPPGAGAGADRGRGAAAGGSAGGRNGRA